MDEMEEYDDYLAAKSAQTRGWKRTMSLGSGGAEDIRLCRAPPVPCSPTTTQTFTCPTPSPLNQNEWGDADPTFASSKAWTMPQEQRVQTASRSPNPGQYNYQPPVLQNTPAVQSPPAMQIQTPPVYSYNATPSLIPPIAPQPPPSAAAPYRPMVVEQATSSSSAVASAMNATQAIAMPVTIPAWALGLILFFVGLFVGILILLPVVLVRSKNQQSTNMTNPSTFDYTSSYIEKRL